MIKGDDMHATLVNMLFFQFFLSFLNPFSPHSQKKKKEHVTKDR
jgi:hypothetical protein